MIELTEMTIATAPASAPEAVDARRDEPARRTARLRRDLGGLAYEMAIRDHLRPDVLVRMAAELQPIDAELGAVERVMALDDGSAAGKCPAVGAA